ncbi:MAG: PAS domain-containing protein [Candidatus Eisenbacteria bacterium]|nr:PAS domain-containing protein [Candidatus Eisenbacteria bacterium]
MRRRKLLWHLFPSYLLITIIAVAAVSLYAYLALRDFYLEETATALTARARLLAERSRPLIEAGDDAALDALVGELGAAVSTRITVIAPSGVVLADSDEDRAVMDNHADRPEVFAAMSGEVGTSQRYSYTLKQNMMYVAVPLMTDDGVGAVVRTSIPLTATERQLERVRGRILLAALVLLAVATVVSFVVSERIARPLRSMERGALRFARGEFRHNIPVPRTAELASLAESMNKMAAELDDRMRAIVQQQAEQEAVLGGMTEGVVAVDREERIITLNSAAAGMFGIGAEAARGRALQELVRNAAFHEIVAGALKGEGPIEKQMALGGPDERIVEAHAAPLWNEKRETSGAVVVLNDVTRLRRLENVRRDFVANVSHELRTPITSIKGFVETLRDGLEERSGKNARFLEIIGRHVDRLSAIIDDLLYLSRIEEDAEQTALVLESQPVASLLRQAIDMCAPAAADKRVRIIVNVDERLSVRVNRSLVEHAVANLVDNAVKYSEPGGVVEVEAELDDNVVEIRVRDTGPGIAEEHRSRIFERFYQVDKSRSREMGGTGLGLAIAKHIVQAHGGAIGVRSILNQGSTFWIRLPPNGRFSRKGAS